MPMSGVVTVQVQLQSSSVPVPEKVAMARFLPAPSTDTKHLLLFLSSLTRCAFLSKIR